MFDSYLYISFVSVYICIYIYVYTCSDTDDIYLFKYIHMYTWALSLNHLGTVPNVYGLFFWCQPALVHEVFRIDGEDTQ